MLVRLVLNETVLVFELSVAVVAEPSVRASFNGFALVLLLLSHLLSKVVFEAAVPAGVGTVGAVSKNCGGVL